MTIEERVCASCGATSSVRVPDDGSSGVWECSARIPVPEGSPEGTADSACDYLNEIVGAPLSGETLVAPGERDDETAMFAAERGHPAVAVENAHVQTIADDDAGRAGDAHRA